MAAALLRHVAGLGSGQLHEHFFKHRVTEHSLFKEPDVAGLGSGQHHRAFSVHGPSKKNKSNMPSSTLVTQTQRPRNKCTQSNKEAHPHRATFQLKTAQNNTEFKMLQPDEIQNSSVSISSTA